MSHISLIQLPLDVLINILKKLSLSNLCNVMLTCKTLRDLLINDNSIWRSISRDKLVLRNSSGNSQPSTLSWYNQYRISHNWCKGIYRSKVIIYHHTNYMPWLKFQDSEALVLSVGSELRCYSADKKGFPNCKDTVWKFEVPKIKRDDVRTNDISRFIIKHNHIVCGNRDGCIALYKLDNIKQKPQFLCHIKDCHENGQTEVTAVELMCNKEQPCVLTASAASSELCFWHILADTNILSGNRYTTAIDNGVDSKRVIRLSDNVGVRCLAANLVEDKLAMGLNGNSEPLLLDVKTGQLLISADATKNIKQAVRDIQWHNENTIMFVTHSGKLQLIDIRTSEVVYGASDPFQSTLYCVKSDGVHALVAGSSEYSRCVLFDSRSPARHVQMYFTQKKSSPVYSLDFDSTKLIAAADRSVAVLNFNVSSAAAERRDYSHAFQFVASDAQQ